jgi:hypothetical protein
MLDEPQQLLRDNGITGSEPQDSAYETRLACIRSPEFTRRLCEHVKRAFRRAIEEGKPHELPQQPLVKE